MPVIINEFEVVPEPPPANQAASQPAKTASSPASPELTRHNLERIMRSQRERFARVRAH